MAQVVSLRDVFLFGAGLYLVKRLLYSKHLRSLPPGPTGWPVVGNLFEISADKSWLDFAELGKKYGDISSISILGTRYVILNSYKAISEILEKQSAKSSDRPHLTMGCDLVGWKDGILFVNQGERFRQYRKHFHRLFGSRSSTATFNPIEEEETRRFLCNVLEQPDNLAAHIRTTAGAIILKVTYGYTVQASEDPFVDLADRAMANISLVTTPGAFLVDIIPALRYLPEWFPGTGFLQDAKKYRQLVKETVTRPHQYVLDQMAAGTANPCFSSTLLEGGISPEEEDIIMWAAINIYLGTSHRWSEYHLFMTSSQEARIRQVVSAIHAFFLAMTIYPEVQKKAQAELDAVVGTERLPGLNDRDSLPYINAVCKEVLRWHVLAPLGIPHVSTEDITFNGFVIPKGSYIIGNSWSILHDETTYPNPEVFQPERFLGESPQPDPHNVCFGFGRRVCLHLAEASVFITVAMSLSVLDILRQVEDGVEIVPKLDVTGGTVSHPKPFKCRITSRSTKAETLLHG
ncbi:cytochrome P450 [Melanogaster broomeanus]|nr:cytochrome P450 [Melanogaster broomeanus]